MNTYLTIIYQSKISRPMTINYFIYWIYQYLNPQMEPDHA